MIPISVIIPMYNAEKYIEKCISSLQNQSYPHWEAVVVDDGSKDQSAQICYDLAAADNRIRLVQQKNQGVSAARNTGIQQAQGERVMFLDADDALEPMTFSELLPYMEADFDVICWSLKTDCKPEPEYYTMSEERTLAYPANENTLRDLRLRTFSGYSLDGKKDQCMHFVVTKLIRRSLILENKLSFDTMLKYGEDTLFSIQVTELAKSIAAVNQHFYIRTMHADSATASYSPTIGENNQRYLNLLRMHIDQYHPQDIQYEVALAKYQLSCFLQYVKLDCMHPMANYSNNIRKQKIKAACMGAVYLPPISLWHDNYKWKHRAMHIAIRFRLVWAIQFAVNRCIL